MVSSLAGHHCTPAILELRRLRQGQLEFMKPVKRKEKRKRKEKGGVGGRTGKEGKCTKKGKKKRQEGRGKEKMSRLPIPQPESLLKPQESTEMSPECDRHRSS